MADLEMDLAPGARVVVAMSGGVDSSVAAALLAEAGFEVIGVTLQLYDHGAALKRKNACCAGRDIQDARAVADAIGIPHYVLDMERRFKAAVIDDFAQSYAEGRTPVPCVRCNERVKFHDLLNVARDLGAKALATGHYARRLPGPALHKARDADKDQSYFLFKTTREQLDYLRFPLGDLTKAETRAQAGRLNLPVAAKPESQDICFVPEGHYSDLVKRLAPDAAAPGEIVRDDGSVVGHHAGIGGFTVGQRRGIGVADKERLYVLRIEPHRNRVVVGPRADGRCRAVVLSETNWIGFEPSPDPVSVMVRHRYNEPAVPAELLADAAGRACVRFEEPEAGVAPGQACVLYRGDRVLGGGWIDVCLTAEASLSTSAALHPALAE